MFEQLKLKFLASFEDKIAHLKQVLEDQDSQALTAAVHQLAGSSGSYGFDDISELCCDIESQVNNDTIDPKAQKLTLLLIKLMIEKIT